MYHSKKDGMNLTFKHARKVLVAIAVWFVFFSAKSSVGTCTVEIQLPSTDTNVRCGDSGQRAALAQESIDVDFFRPAGTVAGFQYPLRLEGSEYRG